MAQRRKSERIKLRSRLKLNHPDSGDVYCYTLDISDAGVGLEVGDWPIPPLGSVVTVQLQDVPIDAPVLEMKVVRVDSNAVGLEFLLDEQNTP